MNELDTLYQQAVDEQAQALLIRGADAARAVPDYGSLPVLIHGQAISCGFWHYRLGTVEHIVFQLQRKLRLGFYRKYLSGVKVTADDKVGLLTSDEVAAYD